MVTSATNFFAYNLKVAFFTVLILSLVSTGYSQQVRGIQGLAFNSIIPGVPETVSKKSTDATEFTVRGPAGNEVALVWTLPEYMSTTGASMPLFFFNTDCQIDTSQTANQASPAYDDLNPHETLTYSLGPNGLLTVWLGGQIVPGLVQKAGAYTATIRLTAAYTGN